MNKIPTFWFDVDLKQNQLLNLVLEKLEDHPNNPKNGRIYFNTDEEVIYYRITNKWVPIGGIRKIDNEDGSILITGTDEEVILNLNVDKTTIDIADDGKIHLKTNSVETHHIKDDQITTIKIKNKNVTFNKLQDMATMTVIGNVENSTTTPKEVKILNSMDDADDQTLITSGAVKLFVEEYFSSLGKFRGEYDPNLSNIPQNPNINTGDYWIINESGTFNGKPVRPGDQIIAKIDNPTTPDDFVLISSNQDEATTTTLGLVRLATNDEALNANNNKVITTSNLVAKTASDQETLDGLIGNKYVTPKSLKFVLDQYDFADKFVQTFGGGTTFTFLHNFNDKFVNFTMFTNDNQQVYMSPVRELDKLTFNFTRTIPTNTYNIAIWK